MTDRQALAAAKAEFDAAFRTYTREVERAGGWVRNVVEDEWGLRTWSAGVDGKPRTILDECYEAYLKQPEYHYLQVSRRWRLGTTDGPDPA